ncbi:MAG: MCP four helix bundle domain-containing protein, partial [Burkholderiaceae bacterium]|nr:MCP four helix bundle domain-containing protein [Burkholderiaceae bacterium]
MFKTLRLAHTLWMAIFLILAALVLVTGMSAFRWSQVQAQADAMVQEMDKRRAAAMRWSGLTETNAARTQALIVSNDPAVEAEFKDLIAATTAEINQVQKALEATVTSDADKAQMARIASARKTMIDLRTQARKLKGEGRHAEAVVLIQRTYNPAVAAYLQTLQDFVRLQNETARSRSQDMADMRRTTLQMAGAAVAVLALLIVVGAWGLIGRIQRPLAEAHGLARRIAEGDLTAHAQVQRGDEFGDLLRSQYAMSAALAQMVSQVRHSTDSISVASAEIASGNQDLSARTELTSSNLQQTAGTLDQFTSTLQQSARHAEQASSLAASASGVAERGGAVVAQVVSTMEEINQSSRQIADIV